MARSISDIQASIIAAVQQDPILSVRLTSTSRVSVWRLWTYIIAVCQWTLENLYDLFVAEVNTTIDEKNPHSPQWYAGKARAFQFGMELASDTDKYDNTGLTDSQVEQLQIVNYAAVVEAVVNNQNVLRIKVATNIDGDLGPLSADQLTAFSAYMQRVKDAGVRLAISSTIADGLKLGMDFYYDPLILNSDGKRNDGTDQTPVQSAIDTFLKNLPFNGVFSINKLVDALQGVPGYKDLKLNYVLKQYGDLPYTSVSVTYVPDSGYLRFVSAGDLAINFIPYEQ